MANPKLLEALIERLLNTRRQVELLDRKPIKGKNLKLSPSSRLLKEDRQRLQDFQGTDPLLEQGTIPQTVPRRPLKPRTIPGGPEFDEVLSEVEGELFLDSLIRGKGIETGPFMRDKRIQRVIRDRLRVRGDKGMPLHRTLSPSRKKLP